MISRRHGLVLCVLFAIASACGTTEHEATRCGGIPTNGCPLDGTANVCADPTCAAAYACNADGSWTLDHACPGFVPVSERDASSPDDAGNVRDSAGFDAPPGANGVCSPPLDDTDCALGTVLACPSGCCGCETLFTCPDPNASWVVWGECEPDGGLVANGN